MVALISKSRIQEFNIDTVEKALVFGTLGLRAALIGKNNINTEDPAVTINVYGKSETEGNLNLEIYLPYNDFELNTNGGQLLDSISEYSSNTSDLETEMNLVSSPSLSGLVIPDYNENVIITFEKYLIYYSQILWASVSDKRNNAVSITFLGNQDNSQVWLSINLPLDLNKWLLGSNYLDAIINVVSSYVEPLNQSEPPDDTVPALDPSLFTINANYSTTIDYPDNYSPMELWTFQSPTILDAIYLDVYYDDIEGAFDCYFYLNGNEISYQYFSDYGDGSYEITFDTTNNPVIFMPGDTLDIEIYDDEQLSQFDANIYVLELPPPPQL
ncbi:MAG: hypothetical protein AB4372_28915 [Xenococcus sp. (in: cyanobacteria)]